MHRCEDYPRLLMFSQETYSMKKAQAFYKTLQVKLLPGLLYYMFLLNVYLYHKRCPSRVEQTCGYDSWLQLNKTRITKDYLKQIRYKYVIRYLTPKELQLREIASLLTNRERKLELQERNIRCKHILKNLISLMQACWIRG